MLTFVVHMANSARIIHNVKYDLDLEMIASSRLINNTHQSIKSLTELYFDDSIHKHKGNFLIYIQTK